MSYRVSVLILIAMIGLGQFMVSSSARAATMEIVAVVNEDAVSERDLNKRLKLVMASSGLPNNQEIRSRLIPQVLDGLINERIMLQEARKLELGVSQEEIDAGLQKIAAQNKFKPTQFRAMLKKAGIDITTMHDQIKSQVAWSKVVKARLRPRIVISERDIDDALERIKAKIGATEYLVAEIYLPIADAKKAGDIKKLANRMVREIRGGKASFFKLAQQFSQSAGARNGGDMGWLNESQMEPELYKAISSIKKQQVTNSIKTPSGYHILFLRDSRTLTEANIPTRSEIEYNIGMDRIEKVQRRHLMDLRTSSFVDLRL